MRRKKPQTLKLKTNNRAKNPNNLNLLKLSLQLSLQKKRQSRLDQQKSALKVSEISQKSRKPK